MSTSNRRMLDKTAMNPTVISEYAAFKGELKGRSPVIVLGEFEGNCDLDGLLTIERSGHWTGDITSGNMVLNGRVEGNVVVKGKLEIGSTGEIVGNVFAGFLAIAAGAVIQGDIKMTAGMEPLRFEEKRKNA